MAIAVSSVSLLCNPGLCPLPPFVTLNFLRSLRYCGFFGLVDLGLPLPLPSIVSLFGSRFFQFLFVSEEAPLPRLELFVTVRATCLRPN